MLHVCRNASERREARGFSIIQVGGGGQWAVGGGCWVLGGGWWVVGPIVTCALAAAQESVLARRGLPCVPEGEQVVELGVN